MRAARMVAWLQQEDHLRETHACDIDAHVANQFPVRAPLPARYYVSATPHPGALHSESVSILGRRLRTYYVCPYVSDVDAAQSNSAAVVR